jgi:hypothetical protein
MKRLRRTYQAITGHVLANRQGEEPTEDDAVEQPTEPEEGDERFDLAARRVGDEVDPWKGVFVATECGGGVDSAVGGKEVGVGESGWRGVDGGKEVGSGMVVRKTNNRRGSATNSSTR